MTTATEAFIAIRTRIESGSIAYNGSAILMRWQNETSHPIPDETPFVFTEFLTEPGGLAGYGGGAGANLYRNPARVHMFAFVPQNWGLTPATEIAELFAARLRSYRDTDVSIFEVNVYPGGDGASIKPPGWDSAVVNYFFAVAEAVLYFDQIG